MHLLTDSRGQRRARWSCLVAGLLAAALLLSWARPAGAQSPSSPPNLVTVFLEFLIFVDVNAGTTNLSELGQGEFDLLLGEFLLDLALEGRVSNTQLFELEFIEFLINQRLGF
jgi:hypothetical protein